MGKAITLGGERLGSGKKSKVYLHNYERSTHNLSRRWASTIGVGMLIPFYCKLATRDDKFEIDLNAGLRTIPTRGPLFGSFKLQLDMFQCPLRLYQALLHNNPTAIGLKTNQIKWPKLVLHDDTPAGEENVTSACANNSLLKYFDIGGIGTMQGDTQEAQQYSREFFGAHVLAYYDIFKYYYANKQEENAYTIGHERIQTSQPLRPRTIGSTGAHVNVNIQNSDNYTQVTYSWTDYTVGEIGNRVDWLGDLNGNDPKIYEYDVKRIQMLLQFRLANNTSMSQITGTLESLIARGYIRNFTLEQDNKINILFNAQQVIDGEQKFLTVARLNPTYASQEEVILKEFPLKNIDQMRMDILSFHQMGQSFKLDGDQQLIAPYIEAIGNSENKLWKNNLAGICIKTYQNDLFNNWINTEWIDGENGIAEITAIATTEGSIKIDALNFAEKLYNLLNRVAASDGTYEGYLDVAYTESDKRFCESPMWIGGMSDEIVFEEIVQTAPAGDGQLGTLGGRGNLLGKHKGGKITCKVDEPSLIIGIVSITPRIMYTQGTEWHNTELDSLADIHVPALDGIAFQNLMAGQMHFGADFLHPNGTITRPVVGKVPAWINYMTDFDRAYGDFAATGGDGYMILNRNYEVKDGELIDATTYIDPAKFNYAFAYDKRDAQNFWIQINCDVKARRLMSAKQIPSI